MRNFSQEFSIPNRITIKSRGPLPTESSGKEKKSLVCFIKDNSDLDWNLNPKIVCLDTVLMKKKY